MDQAIAAAREKFLRRFRPDESGCWEWEGYRDSEDYGRMYVGRKGTLAHRFSYELFVGPIPDGLVIDHLCRNHGCVNPAHLEPVTNRENILRGTTITAENAKKTHCHRGHAFDAENTYITPRGTRACRACAELHRVRWRARNG